MHRIELVAECEEICGTITGTLVVDGKALVVGPIMLHEYIDPVTEILCEARNVWFLKAVAGR